MNWVSFEVMKSRCPPIVCAVLSDLLPKISTWKGEGSHFSVETPGVQDLGQCQGHSRGGES